MKRKEWIIVVFMFVSFFFIISFPVKFMGVPMSLDDVVFRLLLRFFRQVRFTINAK